MATSVAAVAAAATIASQKFMEGGSIHNDTDTAAAFTGSKVDPRTTAKVRVDGGNDEEQQLSLLVWGSNR